MGLLKIVECKGYTRDEAFANLNFNPNHIAISGVNCTQAWTKIGRPLPGTKAFNIFITEQLAEKTKNVPGLGLYIVIDPPIQDIRKRPYSIINNPVEGTRDWTLVYQVREDDLNITELPSGSVNEDGDYIIDSTKTSIDIASIGKVIAECSSKAEALAEAKRLTTDNKRSYTIVPVKIPDLAKISAYCVYTPSAKAKEGTFIAFGFNEE